MEVSVVLPVYNEEESIHNLYTKLKEILENLNKEYEIIMIDDGSSDKSALELNKLADKDPLVKVISFRRNFGQTAATTCGIDHSTGDIIIIMDSDFQNDPEDIPNLLAKLEEGYDVISGYRKDRKDKFIRTIFSKVANILVTKISGVYVADLGCSLKAYRTEILKDVKLYGEMHRFLPIYTHWVGGKIANIPVKHHPRRFGNSKYGLSRTFKVIVDLFVIKFLGYYATKPMYFFGKIAATTTIVSLLFAIIYFAFALIKHKFHTYLLIMSTFLGLATICFISFGILAEMMVRIYHESQNKPTYFIKDKKNV